MPNPPPAGAFPLVQSMPALPRGHAGELRSTWVGHVTFLLQIGTVNILTDPVWSKRVSPLPWLGPARLADPGLPFDALPPIDAVLLTHDHYDHLDRPTVRRLHGRFGDELSWIVPLGYSEWLARQGVTRVVELDWWQSARFKRHGSMLDVVALPAQHWTRRSIARVSTRLWASYAIRSDDGIRVYFACDSGYFPGFREIGRRLGPFDATFLPIGAYDPRWFMRPAHMNPEEAVRAYQDLGGRGTFVAMHWGTFQLTDEPPLEPPQRARRAWDDAGLPREQLWVPTHGETRTLRKG